MAKDFSLYLDVDVESVEAPLPLPIGHYFATIQKWATREVEYEHGTKTPVVTLTFKTTGEDEDVDSALLPPGGAADRILTRDYRLNDPDKSGLFSLRRLAEESCKLPVKGLQFTDLLDALKGQDVKLYVEQRITDDERVFPRVTRVLSATD